jgi:hypothetical protein
MKNVCLVVLLIGILGVPSSTEAYDSSCSTNARRLKDAAEAYDSALSDLESAESDVESEQSSYEGACSPDWGYAANDEGACGAYGFERLSLESAIDELESAKSELESAQSELEYAMGRVSRSCGDAGSGMSPLLQTCLGELRKTTSQLEACEQKIRGTDNP